MYTPEPPLPRVVELLRLVPMKLPTTLLLLVPLPSMYTPSNLLPEMTLYAVAEPPPTVLPLAPLRMSTPSLAFGKATPEPSVPMSLPWTLLPDVPLPPRPTPLLRLPEMMLPAPDAVPPMVLLVAPA